MLAATDPGTQTRSLSGCYRACSGVHGGHSSAATRASNEGEESLFETQSVAEGGNDIAVGDAPERLVEMLTRWL